MPPKAPLTPYAAFAESTTAELKSAGRSRVPAVELADRWRSISEAARKPWEEKAALAQEAYLAECTQRFLDAGGEAADDGGEEADDAEEEADDANGDEDGAEEKHVRTSTRTSLPWSRVKKIGQDHIEHGTLSREATFAVSKATEAFVDRCVWGAVRFMNRSGRKVVTVPDLVSALKLHPCPESMQYFVEELQPAPPPPQPKVKPSKSRKENKRKKPAKAAAQEPVEISEPPPPKKRGRPAKS